MKRVLFGMLLAAPIGLVSTYAAAASLTYDGAGRLASYRTGRWELRYEYDGGGALITICRRRLRETTWRCRELVRDDGALSSVVATIDGTDVRLLADSPSGPQTDAAWTLQDQLGSARALVSPTGAVSARRAWSAYGDERVGSPAGGPGYTGEWQEEGLVDLRARVLDPAIGRFAQRDSWISGGAGPQGLHRYAYVSNSPLNAVDPSGHAPLDYLWDIPIAVASGIDCINTWSDPCASGLEKGIACGAAAIDIGTGILPYLPAGAGRAARGAGAVPNPFGVPGGPGPVGPRAPRPYGPMVPGPWALPPVVRDVGKPGDDALFDRLPNYGPFMRGTAEALADGVNLGPTTVRVAERGGLPVGAMQVGPSDRLPTHLEIGVLEVSADARKGGVGGALFDDALQLARQRGNSGLVINSVPQATEFYEKMELRHPSLHVQKSLLTSGNTQYVFDFPP